MGQKNGGQFFGRRFVKFRSLIVLLALMVSGALFSPVFASDFDSCEDCHGDIEQIHQGISHIPALQVGAVTIFPDDGHDDAGWIGTPPYFAVPVDCYTCHAQDLIKIHASNCDTCHPTPYDTFENDPAGWLGGCQQGGCHQGYHADSSVAHIEWDNTQDPNNNCLLCHVSNVDLSVPQENCLNCHAAYDENDTTPPVTTTNIADGATFIGPARVKFQMTDNGKVGLGTTFYRMDNLSFDVFAGAEVFVTEPGTHELEFYSVDQAGNQESPTKLVFFEVVEDTENPVTTSNIIDGAVYYNGALFSLNATDNGTLGVKNTYYSINGGSAETGTTIAMPNTVGTFIYTINYWSEDWAGNVEPVNSAAVTVKSGTGTIRLTWNGGPGPDDYASWTVRRGGATGTIVATGSGGPGGGWDGIDDIPVSITPTPYHVTINWEWQGYPGQTIFNNVVVDDPGEVVELVY